MAKFECKKYEVRLFGLFVLGFGSEGTAVAVGSSRRALQPGQPTVQE